jgi:hypothetical protein
LPPTAQPHARCVPAEQRDAPAPQSHSEYRPPPPSPAVPAGSARQSCTPLPDAPVHAHPRLHPTVHGGSVANAAQTHAPNVRVRGWHAR